MVIDMIIRYDYVSEFDCEVEVTAAIQRFINLRDWVFAVDIKN